MTATTVTRYVVACPGCGRTIVELTSSLPLEGRVEFEPHYCEGRGCHKKVKPRVRVTG